MVVLNKIYTRTGDDGTTALGSGERRKKYDLRIAAYGTVDEVNAAIGVVRLHTASDPALDAATAKYILDHYAPLVDSISIGQEPSAYPVQAVDTRPPPLGVPSLAARSSRTPR